MKPVLNFQKTSHWTSNMHLRLLVNSKTSWYYFFRIRPTTDLDLSEKIENIFTSQLDDRHPTHMAELIQTPWPVFASRAPKMPMHTHSSALRINRSCPQQSRETLVSLNHLWAHDEKATASDCWNLRFAQTATVLTSAGFVVSLIFPILIWLFISKNFASELISDLVRKRDLPILIRSKARLHHFIELLYCRWTSNVSETTRTLRFRNMFWKLWAHPRKSHATNGVRQHIR